VNLCAEFPKISTQTLLRRVLQPTVSPQRWTSPRVLKLRKLQQNPRSPQAQRMHEAPLVSVVLHLLQPVPPRAKTLWALPQAQKQPSPLKHLPQAPSPMDSGLSMGISMVRTHLCLSLKNHRNSIHGLQSPCGTTQNLSRLDSTSGGS
jgi:hypothetical protein